MYLTVLDERTVLESSDTKVETFEQKEGGTGAYQNWRCMPGFDTLLII